MTTTAMKETNHRDDLTKFDAFFEIMMSAIHFQP